MTIKKSIIILTVLVSMIVGYGLSLTNVFKSTEAVTITSAQAKESALKEFSGIITKFRYEIGDSVPYYNFEIIGTSEKVELEVNATTGDITIIERSKIDNPIIEINSQSTEQINSQETATTNTTTPKITEEQARSTALKLFSGTITEHETIRHSTNEVSTNLQSSALTSGPSTSSSEIITRAQAISIAQKQANGMIIKVEYEADEHHYEIIIRSRKVEYEFKIHASSGAILYYKMNYDN